MDGKTVAAGVVILAALLISAFSFSGTDSAVSGDLQNVSAVHPPNLTAVDRLVDARLTGGQVIDCRDSVCTGDVIEERYIPGECNQWGPWDPPSDLECNWTEQNIGEVRLVTDVGNYIPVPLTDAAYTVTYSRLADEQPWDLEFLPDGRMLYTSRPTGVYLREDGEDTLVKRLDVETTLETGVLGLAVDPDFEENGYVYVFYMSEYATPNEEMKNPGGRIVHNRVSRFTLENRQLVNETVLLDNITGSGMFSGGRLEIGPDEKLYISTGDGGSPGWDTADDPQALNGKVLRMNLDGTVPEDNPFNESYAYSIGHRNPQGLAFNPENGVVYENEHGDNRHDELNRVLPGKDYGWPTYSCAERYEKSQGMDQTTPWEGPARCFANWTIAPSGLTFVDSPGHPWHGDLFMAGLRGNHVHRFDIEDGEVQDEEIFFIPDGKEMSVKTRDVEFYNGSLYVTGDAEGGRSRDSVAKLTPS